MRKTMARRSRILDVMNNRNAPAYIIAEGGINHNGSVELAKKLIDAAAEAGADCFKLQKRTIETVYTKEELDKPRESPWGTTNREQKLGLEFGKVEYQELAAYANKLGLDFTASAWDARALLNVIEWTNPPWLKVASASLTDDVLLRNHVAFRRPIVLSTGMSTLAEIEHAVMVVAQESNDLGEWPGLALLACTSTYPCEDSEINLRTIEALAAHFNYQIPVGYSGHERGVATSVAAVALGARIVERHLTLDRTMYGSDQAASLEPKGFALMVRDIRTIEAAMGDGNKRRLESEEPVRAKLRRVG